MQHTLKCLHPHYISTQMCSHTHTHTHTTYTYYIHTLRAHTRTHTHTHTHTQRRLYHVAYIEMCGNLNLHTHQNIETQIFKLPDQQPFLYPCGQIKYTGAFWVTIEVGYLGDNSSFQPIGILNNWVRGQ